ncbi:MAG: hypothetical protein RLZZ493_1013, partial [Bacteroidota bacterium]
MAYLFFQKTVAAVPKTAAFLLCKV